MLCISSFDPEGVRQLAEKKGDFGRFLADDGTIWKRYQPYNQYESLFVIDRAGRLRYRQDVEGRDSEEEMLEVRGKLKEILHERIDLTRVHESASVSKATHLLSPPAQ